MRRLAIFAALPLFLTALPNVAAADDLTVRCRGDLPVHPREQLRARSSTR